MGGYHDINTLYDAPVCCLTLSTEGKIGEKQTQDCDRSFKRTTGIGNEWIRPG